MLVNIELRKTLKWFKKYAEIVASKQRSKVPNFTLWKVCYIKQSNNYYMRDLCGIAPDKEWNHKVLSMRKLSGTIAQHRLSV